MSLMEEIGRILEYGDICDHCLGRLYGRRSFGLTNEARGSALRVAYFLDLNQPFQGHTGSCWICGDLFAGVPVWAERVVRATEGVEYSTFLIGYPGTATHGRERGDGMERPLPAGRGSIKVRDEP